MSTGIAGSFGSVGQAASQKKPMALLDMTIDRVPLRSKVRMEVVALLELLPPGTMTVDMTTYSYNDLECLCAAHCGFKCEPGARHLAFRRVKKHDNEEWLLTGSNPWYINIEAPLRVWQICLAAILEAS